MVLVNYKYSKIFKMRISVKFTRNLLVNTDLLESNFLLNLERTIEQTQQGTLIHNIALKTA